MRGETADAWSPHSAELPAPRLLPLGLLVPGLRESQLPAAAAVAASVARLRACGLLGLSRASAPALSADARRAVRRRLAGDAHRRWGSAA